MKKMIKSMQQCDIGCFPGFLIFQLVNTYHTKEIWVSMVSNRNRVLLFCIVALNLFVECFHFHFIKMNHLLIVSLIFCLHSVYCLILLTLILLYFLTLLSISLVELIISSYLQWYYDNLGECTCQALC